MAEWHIDPSCSRPDIITAGGISSCLSCGSVQPDPGSDGIYQPLEGQADTRLLTIEGGDFEDPVRGSLSPSSTSALVDYDATSYTWGGEDRNIEKMGRIWLCGREFAVAHKCEAALRRVRSRGAPKVVWLDAVCMNQEDVDERGHHVRLMPQIYSRAQRVRIYLGEPSPEEEDLLCYLADNTYTLGPEPLSRWRLQPLQDMSQLVLMRRH